MKAVHSSVHCRIAAEITSRLGVIHWLWGVPGLGGKAVGLKGGCVLEPFGEHQKLLTLVSPSGFRFTWFGLWPRQKGILKAAKFENH